MAKTKRPWLKRENFIRYVEAWLKANPGKSRDDLAEKLGWKDRTVLKQYTQANGQYPGRDRIDAMVELFGCHEWELNDDKEPPQLISKSPANQILDNVLFEVVKMNLTDEQATLMILKIQEAKRSLGE